jgi:hypothetical protein
MPCLCDCLYTGKYDGKCARCAVMPLLFIVWLIVAVISTPWVIMGAIGVAIFYPFKKMCEDCCCDTILYYSCYSMMMSWRDAWQFTFSRRHGGDEEQDIY